MIANRVGKEADGQTLYKKLNSVVQRFLKLPLTYLGCVPYDSQLSDAVMQQMPVSLKNPAAKSSQAYERIARSLLDENETGATKARGMAAFFSHIVSRR